MKKSGQAAMEFLMTYGWALLIVLVAIAVLAAMGVFSGARFGATICLLQPAFSCDGVVRNNGEVQVQLTQGTGTDLNTFSLWLSNSRQGGNPVCRVAGPDGYFQLTTPGTLTTFPDGSQLTFSRTTGACTTTELTAGSRFQADLIAAYTQTGISHRKVGQLRVNVES